MLFQHPRMTSKLRQSGYVTIMSGSDIKKRYINVRVDRQPDIDPTNFAHWVSALTRFMFTRLPYGISSAPEYFQKRMDKKLTSLQGWLCHMEDILVIGRNKEEHEERLVKVLQRLKDSGIMLNPDKCLFSTSRLQYLGQVIDIDGIRKDPAKNKAITELREPKDVPDVRRFIGMVNQQMKFLPNLAEVTKPIRDLLNPIDPNPAISARAVFPQSGRIRPEKQPFFQNFPYFSKLEPIKK